MIGYVLLITFAIIMGGIVYQWMKSYVPTETLECPDGVAITIDEATCEEISEGVFNLNLSLINNGRFDIDGYTIHAADNEFQKVATKDLSGYTRSGEEKGGIVLYSMGFGTGDLGIDRYYWDADSGIGNIYSIQIAPIRFQEKNGKSTLVICGDAGITETITCK